MENESVSGTALKEGQSVKGPTERTETTTTETKTDGGQPKETKSTTESGTTDKGTTQKVIDEDSFMDADEEIKASPALLKKYKDMQASFTRKTRGVKGERAKLEAYDAFMRNPKENLKQLARQYGVEIGEPKPTENEPWEPKTWDDVISRAKKEAIADARREIMDELNPVIRDVNETRKKNIESFLDENAPDWKEYEEDMMENLREHPSLVKDPLKLYLISVPAEVMESRAYQKALKKMQDKTQSSQLSATSTTKKSESSLLPDKAMSFSEAVEFAKRQLADKGIAAPRQ